MAIVRYLSEGSGPANCSSAPLWLFADNISSTKVTVHWDPLTGANKYKVQYRVTGTKTWTSSSATANEKTLKNLTASITYEYRVKGICDNGSSPWSNIATFTTTSLKLNVDFSNPEELTISVYPNPVSDIMNVSIDKDITNGYFIIYDFQGRSLITERIIDNAQIDVSSFSPGVYILEVKGENITSKYQKILVN